MSHKLENTGGLFVYGERYGGGGGGGPELSWTAGGGGSELYELGGPAELAVDVDWAMRPKCELDGRVLSGKISTGWFLLSSMALPIFVTPPPEMFQGILLVS